MTIQLAGYTLPDPVEYREEPAPDGTFDRMAPGNYRFNQRSTSPVVRKISLGFSGLSSSQKQTLLAAYTAAVVNRVQLSAFGQTLYVRAKAKMKFEPEPGQLWNASLELEEEP